MCGGHDAPVGRCGTTCAPCRWLQFCEAVKGGQPAKAAELRMAVLRDLAALRSAVQRQQVQRHLLAANMCFQAAT